MELKVTGVVANILEEQSGSGRNGPWRKQDFILETGGQYPKQICMAQWGDNIENFSLQQGETVTAHIDLASREYNGRWYTDVKAWKVERGESTGSAAGPSAQPAQAAAVEPGTVWKADDADDDLPF